MREPTAEGVWAIEDVVDETLGERCEADGDLVPWLVGAAFLAVDSLPRWVLDCAAVFVVGAADVDDGAFVVGIDVDAGGFFLGAILTLGLRFER